jgi:hypothetical protein
MAILVPSCAVKYCDEFTAKPAGVMLGSSGADTWDTATPMPAQTRAPAAVACHARQIKCAMPLQEFLSEFLLRMRVTQAN